MRFEQTADLLRYVRDLHEELAEAYSVLAEKVPDRRNRMLLDYMAVREKGGAEAVGAFARSSSDLAVKEFDPAILNPVRLRKRLASELQPDSSTDEILDFGLEVHDWFLKLYDTLLAKSKTEELQALFRNLRDRTSKGKEKLARNANMLMDF